MNKWRLVRLDVTDEISGKVLCLVVCVKVDQASILQRCLLCDEISGKVLYLVVCVKVDQARILQPCCFVMRSVAKFCI